MEASPEGSSRDSVSPCSSRSTIAWCSSRSRFSAAWSPADTPAAIFTKTASTSASTTDGGRCRTTAIALIVLPAATMPSRSSSSADSPPGDSTGRTSASTISGSRAVPPVATDLIASASCVPSATRSLSRYPYPADPAASSDTAYSGSSYWESTTTPVPGNRDRTSLAASIPSRRKDGGIRTSVTRTCGSVAAQPDTTPS